MRVAVAEREGLLMIGNVVRIPKQIIDRFRSMDFTTSAVASLLMLFSMITFLITPGVAYSNQPTQIAQAKPTQVSEEVLSQAPDVEFLTLSNFYFYIDPGHNPGTGAAGCNDRGTGPHWGVYEGDLTLDVALRLRDLLILRGVTRARQWTLLNPVPPNGRCSSSCPCGPNNEGRYNSFVDVCVDNPFYRDIETAFARGIIGGYADGTFRYGNSVTRAQISKMVDLALRSDNHPPPANPCWGQP